MLIAERFTDAVSARAMLLGCAMAGLLYASRVEASVIGFTENPTGNFAAWGSFMAPFGSAANIDFDDHPVGSLDPSFYSESHGLTFQPAGAIGPVMFGEGPGESNSTGPISEGEGPHAASNFLLFGPGPASLTVTFGQPVFGGGMFLIDYFNPLGDRPVTISAFSGPDGTGAALGSFVSASYNFEPNNMYFMGIGSSAGDIRSISLEMTGGVTPIVGGMDDWWLVPEPGTGGLLLLGSIVFYRRSNCRVG